MSGLFDIYSTKEQIKSTASSIISIGTDSTYVTALAATSRHFACSHITSPVVLVLPSNLIWVGNLLILVSNRLTTIKLCTFVITCIIFEALV